MGGGKCTRKQKKHLQRPREENKTTGNGKQLILGGRWVVACHKLGQPARKSSVIQGLPGEGISPQLLLSPCSYWKAETAVSSDSESSIVPALVTPCPTPLLAALKAMNAPSPRLLRTHLPGRGCNLVGEASAGLGVAS